MGKPIVALMYDFDNTLSTKDMQEYGYIDAIKMTPKEFWQEVAEFTDKNGMDNILAYMYKMVDKAHRLRIPVKESTFKKLGKDIEFFPGVETWFDRINEYGKSIGVEVEHYIVSSGIKEIIEGTSIKKNFKKIYACEFLYDEYDSIVWPKVAVNYTAKTQFLFRINKGILEIDTSSSKELNKFTPDKKRRIPFGNMIYVGDGLTDVPCMKLVKINGGISIAVYHEDCKGESARELLKNNRVNYVTIADYREGSEIENIVQTAMRKIKVVAELESFK